MSKKIVMAAFTIGWILCLASGYVFAQATSTLNGRIVDQGGAVVPGASVVVTSTSTGAARDTVTNGEGLYSVPALNPGTYGVKVQHTGFAAAVRDGVQLLAGSTISVDLQLGVAQQQQTVEVTG
jgi:Carboxypeptidase regulatory-like domain